MTANPLLNTCFLGTFFVSGNILDPWGFHGEQKHMSFFLSLSSLHDVLRK